MDDSIRYFNAPVQLLEDFLINHQKSLRNILHFGIYEHSVKYVTGTEIESFEESAAYLRVVLNDVKWSFENGQRLYKKFGSGCPKFGINTKIFWDYYKDENKKEFDLVCLLAFLAMKSIIQNKPCQKLTNNYLLSRMAGMSKVCEKEFLPHEIKKYSNEYQLKKIKNNLSIEKWGLKTYSNRTRGFYISFKLELEDLMLYAEKNKLKNKQIEYKKMHDETLARVLKKLRGDF